MRRRVFAAVVALLALTCCALFVVNAHHPTDEGYNVHEAEKEVFLSDGLNDAIALVETYSSTHHGTVPPLDSRHLPSWVGKAIDEDWAHELKLALRQYGAYYVVEPRFVGKKLKSLVGDRRLAFIPLITLYGVRNINPGGIDAAGRPVNMRMIGKADLKNRDLEEGWRSYREACGAPVIK